MKENFDRALAFVLQYEGGYSDHPSDPGGATNRGITIAELAAVRGHAVTKDDVRALTVAEAGQIYRTRYWAAIRGDDLPAGVDVAVFDCAVNQGVGRATRFLQQASGATVDGVLGPKTLAAAQHASLDEFMAQRMNSYGLLSGLFKTFGLGWSRRLMACYALSASLLKSIDDGDTDDRQNGL